MSESFPQPHALETIDTKQISDAHKYNAELLNGYLQERIHTLRAGVFSKLLEHNALIQGVSWALFTLHGEDAEGSVATQPNKEILLMTLPTSSTLHHNILPASVRIITNECFRSPEGDDEYLSIDFTLDGEDDSLYFISASNGTDYEDTLAPLFWVDCDGDIVCTPNFSFFTPSLCITDTESQGEVVVPFGSIESFADTIDALEVGSQLFAEVKNLIPSYASRQQ